MPRETVTVTFYGGPLHGRRFKVPEDVHFVTAFGGHYGRVTGGRENEMYWQQGLPPIAMKRGGVLVPVLKKSHEYKP